MAVKTIDLETIGTVSIYKRKGTQSLRLMISADGKVRVTIPTWATYDEGARFARSRTAWIAEHLPKTPALLRDGQHIGKAHRLVFEIGKDPNVRTRLAGSDIRIIRPYGLPATDPSVQEAAAKACIRALRTEAQKLLPGRLRQLAENCGLLYDSVQVKQLKGRWGSCDSRRHIVLNLYLMQLPWTLIDYVLLHELVHTKHLNHGAEFWSLFLYHEPRAKSYRAQIRKHKPVLEAIEHSWPVA